MNLPTLIFIALAIPLTIVGLLLLFVRHVEWLEKRPVLRARFNFGLGAYYTIWPAWLLTTEGFSFMAGAMIVMGIAVMGSAIYEERVARRTRRTQFESGAATHPQSVH